MSFFTMRTTIQGEIPHDARRPTLACLPLPNDGEPTPLSNPPHLLIVDDISDNRAVLARRFIRRGYRITEAASGDDALALMKNARFDAVLLDIIMPGIDGFEVLRRARRLFSASELPIIMVTAKSASQDIVQAFADQANDYLTKPVDFAVALARVEAQVERKRAEQEVRRVSEALRESHAVLVGVNDRLRLEIDQRERSEAQSLYLAYHDTLTGLPNRLHFRRDLESALEASRSSGQHLAVLFVDLDGFKNVNDTIGHTIGDLLLQSVARAFQGILTEGSRIARMGGDEFAILQVGGSQPESAMRLADRAIQVVKKAQEIEGHLLSIGASIGIVVADQQDDMPETLLKNADLAMYRAKADGRGTFRIYNPDMALSVENRRLLEIDLRQALVLGQFELFYQPLIALKTGRISGFEALLRWRHPVRGMVSPAEFIPVAEEIGLIGPLGAWVLRQACLEAASWPAPVKVAVNVSPMQFAGDTLVPAVVTALGRAGLPPRRLEVEITESVLLESADRNLDALRQLRDLGVHISMDDFGTGYSSLSYLLRFKFDKIKIDQSFVRDVAVKAESHALIRAIAGLAVGFGISTTAEGVETQDQMERLSAEGCTEAQGYLFSRPVPGSDVPGLLRRFGVNEPAP